MATDAHVVSPLFFLGRYRLPSVHGTINDVAVMGRSRCIFRRRSSLKKASNPSILNAS